MMEVTDEMVIKAVHAYQDEEIRVFGEVRTPNNGARHGAMRAALEAALSHAAGQDGEQCRAASGLADHEAFALVDLLIDAVWDEANSAHKGTTGECVNAAKETERVKRGLLRALSRGVPEGDDSLPRPLWPVSKEWYRLCERRFAVDRITISGKLAEAIVDAVCGPAIAAQRKEGEK